MEGYPFVIAEMSGNHNNSIDLAFQLIEAAKDAGADAVKFQTYTPDTMTLDSRASDFVINDPKSLWNGSSLYELFGKACTPWEWHSQLFEHAKKLDLIAFSSPFDISAVDFLEELDVPIYKIASFECIDLPLIQRAASTKKPLIISTGMASLVEIAEAVDTAMQYGCEDLTILKCTTSYPASPKDSNILTIPHLKQLFGCKVGLSDHTLGIGASIGAVALGADTIERHLTIDRANGGVDSAFSLEPSEFKQLTDEIKRVKESLGTIHYGPTANESKSKLRRRSLYISHDVLEGEALTDQNLRSIRPGHGIPPKYLPLLIGKRVNRNLAKGQPMSWDYIG